MNTIQTRQTDALQETPDASKYRQSLKDASTYWKSFEVELTQNGRLIAEIASVLDDYIRYALELLEHETKARMKLDTVAYSAVHYSVDGVVVIGTVCASPLPGEHPKVSPKRLRQR